MPTQPPKPPITKAAALQYDKNKDAAPKLTAKGKGPIAEKILEIARENNIPIHRDEDLLEILETVEVDTEIPLEVYQVVAEIFSFLYQANQKRKG